MPGPLALGHLKFAAFDVDALDRLHAGVVGSADPYLRFGNGAVACAYCRQPQGEPHTDGCPARFLGAMLDRWPMIRDHLRRSIALLEAVEAARLALASDDRVTAPPTHLEEAR